VFGKLKDKLKGALNVFSKKAEEEAIEKEIEVEEVVEKEVEQEVEEKKDEIVEKTPGKEDKKETKEVVEEKEEPEEKEEIIEKEEEKKIIKEEKKEEAVEGKKLEEPEDKEVDISEEELEKADQLIEEANKEDVEVKEETKEKEEPQEREIPSAESLIEATKEKYVVEELPQKEQDKIKEAERQPTAAELLEEVAEEPEQTEEKVIDEPVKEKKLFGLFKKKEKKEEVIDEKKPEVKEEIKEPIIEEKPVEEPKVEPKEETKKGFFGKVKQSLTTKTISADKFETLFWELEIALLENNVSVEVISKIKEDLKEELVEKPLPRDVPKKIEETLSKTLTEILTFDKIDILEKAKNKKPLIIAFFGINGSGKTTSIAKLANYLKENNLSVVLAACDTFRAAAIQQLEEHANKLEVKMIKHDYGSDAAAVAFDAVKYAEKNNVDVVLIDTAGRLHSNTNLMAELEKIIRTTTPDLKIFIGESITGNDCIEQAKKFNELVEMDGAILTKADIDEKGGAPLSIAYTIKKPILFLGMGQEYKDFEEFDKKVILERLGF